MKKGVLVFIGVLVLGSLISFGCAKKVETAKDAKGADEKVASAPAPTSDSGSQPRIETPVVKETSAGGLNDVYFDFDKSAVRDDAKPALQSNAKWLNSNSKAKIKIEGHADERGTNEYNIALAEKRAQAVSKYLSTLGIKSERLSTISYGEEKPQCAAHSEDCWQKNRRAHFAVVGQ
ncbi:MAG: peptidoglycan-associated lipoprotein Pal [Nitrospirae bacterium]|nr:peptidoglycan-associated lipoprotein Pal [Nitrospirota bacterium]